LANKSLGRINRPSRQRKSAMFRGKPAELWGRQSFWLRHRVEFRRKNRLSSKILPRERFVYFGDLRTIG
jgi:hypothetical protein